MQRDRFARLVEVYATLRSAGRELVLESEARAPLQERIESLREAAAALAPGGRIVVFGATRGNPHELATRKIFWKQLSLLGTTMGSPVDFAAMTSARLSSSRSSTTSAASSTSIRRGRPAGRRHAHGRPRLAAVQLCGAIHGGTRGARHQ